MKVLNFNTKIQDQSLASFQSDNSEVITVNFRKKEVTKMVEICNATGEVRLSYEMIDKKDLFMGGGFSEIIDILIKKNA